MASPESPRQIALNNANLALNNALRPLAEQKGHHIATIAMYLAHDVMGIPPLEAFLVSFSFMAHFLAQTAQSQEDKTSFLEAFNTGVAQFKKALEPEILIPFSIVDTSLAQGQALVAEFFASPTKATRAITMATAERARNAIAEEANYLGGDERRSADHIATIFARNLTGQNS